MPSLDEKHIKHFEEEGYLVVENLLDIEQDIQPLVAEYARLLDDLATQWVIEGKLKSTYQDLSFGKRLSQIMVESGAPISRFMDISLPAKDVMEDSPIHCGTAVFNLLRSPRLLDVVESLIGPEIYSNPIQHVRIKPPEWTLPEVDRFSLFGTTMWHQDQGNGFADADGSDVLTVWVPITDATVENGCLLLVPRSHRGDLLVHCPISRTGINGLNIPEQFLRPEETIPVPIKRGGVLFMHRRTMHASLSNNSDDIRWSFDLRYNPIGQPTGRPFFPGFVARSRKTPESELRDAKVWAELWYQTRTRLAQQEIPVHHRWSNDAPACA